MMREICPRTKRSNTTYGFLNCLWNAIRLFVWYESNWWRTPTHAWLDTFSLKSVSLKVLCFMWRRCVRGRVRKRWKGEFRSMSQTRKIQGKVYIKDFCDILVESLFVFLSRHRCWRYCQRGRYEDERRSTKDVSESLSLISLSLSLNKISYVITKLKLIYTFTRKSHVESQNLHSLSLSHSLSQEFKKKNEKYKISKSWQSI